jgi:hypothetical protein
MIEVAVLFARQDSVYKAFDNLDVYDIDRDARIYSGNLPIVAHLPCRAWGKLKHFAKPRPGEKELAIFAINTVRKNGGVLEHPSGSSLWNDQNLPAPGAIDQFLGYTLIVNQHWFGHRAEKRTMLYIVGCNKEDLPLFTARNDKPTHVVNNSKTSKNKRPEISKAEREKTPVEFAKFLIEIAKNCKR